MYLISILLTLILPQKMVFMENNSCSEGAFEKIAIVVRQQPEADSKSVRSLLIIAKRSHYSLGPLTRRFPKVASLPCISQKEATIHLAHCLGAFRKWPLYPVLQRRSHYSFGPLTRRLPKVASLPCISQKEATIHLSR